MKTKDVKNCVARMQNLPEPQWRAELAQLRRGVGRQPGELPALWGSFLAEMPEELRGTDGPSKAEWAIYLALTLYALHQQGANRAEGSMNQPGQTLGSAVRLLAEKTVNGEDQAEKEADEEKWAESSVCRRFNILATADSMPEISHYLRGMIQQLAVDLYRLQFVESAPNVRLQWGRELYALKNEQKEKEN